MHLDAAELSAFYQTPLGRIARQIVGAEIRAVWPDVRAETVVGLGHTTPYLRPFLGEAERVVAVMPAAEGVFRWPREAANLASLAYEAKLPLADSAVDRLLMVHLLETTQDPNEALREAWRVLVPGGRLLAVVPYRAGAWARADFTPMGLGRPFSRAQLIGLMEACWLDPVDVRRCLYTPPTTRRFVLRSSPAWERVGRRMVPRFAGLLVIEARKTMTRGIPVRPARKLADLVPTLTPVPKPAASYATDRCSERCIGDGREDRAGDYCAVAGTAQTGSGRTSSSER